MNNTSDLLRRYTAALDAIGGTAALLALPEPVKAVLSRPVDLATKVRMLEHVAAAIAHDRPSRTP